MADLAYISTSKITLADIPIVSGQIIHTVDVDESYYDSEGGMRLKFSNVSYLYTEEDRQNYSNPQEGVLYIVTSTANLYKYKLAAGWVRINETAEMYDIIDTVDELVPGTMIRDGVKIAPKTLATSVYTSQGERVEDRLKTISKLGTTRAYLTIPNNNLTEFNIPLPFENYFTLGNFMQVFIGSTLFDERRYYIEDNKLKLFMVEPEFSVGRDITFVFWFNSTTPPVDVSYAINGNYIINGSIPTNKLSGVYNGIDVSNPQLLPSMQSMNTAFTILSDRLNAVAGNLVAHAISEGENGRDLRATIPNFALTDNNTIYLKLHMALESGATLSINGGPARPIYLNYKDPVKSGLAAGDVLNITFSAMYGKFFVNASVAYRLQHYSYKYTALGGESKILIDISEFEPNYDELIVHQNSIRLLNDVHYTISGRYIVLIDYNADAGDMFLFEIDKVKGNGLPLDGNTIMKELVFTEKVFFKNGVDIIGDLDIKGNINLDGELHFSGGASSGSSFTAEQFISTAVYPLPPIVCASTALVENLNADMVDGYHAVDLVIPDDSVEFIIDGETDILDPILQVTFNSFYGRIDALKSRMVSKDGARAEAIKRNILDSVPEDSIDPSDPMYNSVVQDTVEDIVWKLDNLRYMLLTTEASDYDVDNLNDLTGDEIIEGDLKEPVYVDFYNNILEMNRKIDDELFDIESIMLTPASIDYVEPTTFNELFTLSREINTTPVTTTYDEVPKMITLSAEESSQQNATRAKYMMTDGKRIYPITHKNAIVGLPNADLATVKDIQSLQKMVTQLTARLETLEAITGGGVTNKAFIYVDI